jgi:hypothetical protein
MLNINRCVVLVLLVLFISGCSAYGSWFGETKPMLTFAELNASKGATTNSPMRDKGSGEVNSGEVNLEASPENSSRLFVWSPKNTAAFVNSDGKGCVQGAEVFHEKSGKVDVSNELLGILKGIDVGSESPEGSGLAIEIANEILALRTNTERNTYLSIGMFGLCQLQANGGLSNEELLELTKELFVGSLTIGNKNIRQNKLEEKVIE